jgi:hypothetical protein
MLFFSVAISTGSLLTQLTTQRLLACREKNVFKARSDFSSLKRENFHNFLVWISVAFLPYRWEHFFSLHALSTLETNSFLWTTKNHKSWSHNPMLGSKSVFEWKLSQMGLLLVFIVALFALTSQTSFVQDQRRGGKYAKHKQRSQHTGTGRVSSVNRKTTSTLLAARSFFCSRVSFSN